MSQLLTPAESQLLTPAEALERGWYELPSKEPPRLSEISEVERDLMTNGLHIHGVDQAFKDDVGEFAEIAERTLEDPDILKRLGRLSTTLPDDPPGMFHGLERKEAKHDRATGVQVSDAKSIFQISPRAYEQWYLRRGLVREIDAFLEAGREVLANCMREFKDTIYLHLEESHPKIMDLHVPHEVHPTALLRLVMYDGYEQGHPAEVDSLKVAGRHIDRGSMTMQVYASTDGLVVYDKEGSPVEAPPREDGAVYVFPGLAFDKLYGENHWITGTPHEVRRLDVPPGTKVPPRLAIIAFSDPYGINPHISRTEAHMGVDPDR